MYQAMIGGIVLSYSAAPTGGRVTVLDGATTIFDLDITASGPTLLFLRYPKRGSANTSMTITLAAGSGAVVGKLNLNKWTE